MSASTPENALKIMKFRNKFIEATNFQDVVNFIDKFFVNYVKPDQKVEAISKFNIYPYLVFKFIVDHSYKCNTDELLQEKYKESSKTEKQQIESKRDQINIKQTIKSMLLDYHMCASELINIFNDYDEDTKITPNILYKWLANIKNEETADLEKLVKKIFYKWIKLIFGYEK
jgi:hypothetical protein